MFYIGIYLAEEKFYVSILKKEKKTVVVNTLQAFSYGDVKLFYNLPILKGKSTHIVTGLNSTDIFLRKLQLPLKERRKIFAALPFQLESLVPFAEENSVICPLLQPMGKHMTSVTVLTTSQERINKHLLTLKNLDISTDTVSCVPIALMRFALWIFPQESKILLLDSREGKLCCIVIENNELLLSQTIGANSEDLKKLAIYLKQKGVDENIPWVLTGNREIENTLETIFLGKQLSYDKTQLAEFAPSIGLSLDALSTDALSVQFCQKQFTPLHAQQKRKKKILSYLGFCAAATFLMTLGSSLILGKKQKILIDNLKEYLPSSLQVELSSLDAIELKLYEWETSLRGKKDHFPFFVNVPNVSDVLAWMSAHPSFSTEDGNQKEGVELKSLHYTLFKYPKINEASTPYLAQVQLEFTSQTPRPARDFHEALLKGDALVNGKKEIKWHTQNQTYHTTFELNKGAIK